jgi:N-acetylglutamate synthase-like GNAT family acetyltransferase
MRTAQAEGGRGMALQPSDDGVVLRDPAPGDLSLLFLRHMQTVARDFGWNARYEGYLFDIGARFLLRLDPERERFWVAEKGGRVIGCVGIVRENDSTARLRTMFVEPEARGLGLGRRLLEECVSFCRDKGYGTIVLWTLGCLAAARELYASAGFEMISSEPWDEIGPGMMDETWRLDLTPGGGRDSPGDRHGRR